MSQQPLLSERMFDSSRLLVSEGKSCWVPTQVGEWLGYVIDTFFYGVSVYREESLQALAAIKFRHSYQSSSYRELARIAGSIISVAFAVGPISRLLTRQMYLVIESRSAWDHTFCFPPALLEELKFWFNNIESFSVYSIRPPLD